MKFCFYNSFFLSVADEINNPLKNPCGFNQNLNKSPASRVCLIVILFSNLFPVFVFHLL